MDIINRYGIILRFVNEADSKFILKLRTNTALNRFISYTNPDIIAQIKWIQEYKIRKKAGLEYYFIVHDLVGNMYGTIGLYNFDEKSFEIGSLLFDLHSPLGMAT